MKLPEAFKEKMKRLLGEEEYGEFIEALQGERQHGLRVNTLKADVGRFLEVSPFELEPVPWTTDGFYISGEDTPGRHPFYHAGAYYIQEPSAMLPGQILGARPGEKVLDMCAAPGGKTVQIAAAMKGKGLLVANDINTARVKALVKNIELCGVRNALVLNESPEKLIENFEGYFDRILIDAPCSGEGMFRKDETAARSWEAFKCGRCTKLQEPLLECADKLLKPGGTLVYSTCTFSPEENEQMIAGFLRRHCGYELEEIPKIAGMEGGRTAWAEEGSDLKAAAGFTGKECDCAGTEKWDGAGPVTEKCVKSGKVHDFGKAARLWPHKVRGEGHFAVKLIKKTANFCADICEALCRGPGNGNGSAACAAERDGGRRRKPGKGMPPHDSAGICEYAGTEAITAFGGLPECFRAFVGENLNYMPDGVYLIKGRNLYHLPEPPPRLDGLKTAKFGWFLGTFGNGKDDRFEPSHFMATALEAGAFKRVLNLDPSGREAAAYLRGETLMLEGEKGLTAVCVNGWTMGWAKQTGEMLKNLYPAGWRRLS